MSRDFVRRAIEYMSDEELERVEGVLCNPLPRVPNPPPATAAVKRMASKLYNPLEHSVVQAFLKADACNRFEVERCGFVCALLESIVNRLKTAYWNVKQEKFENREDRQFLEIPSFEYRRYFWDECDCGAESPVHAKDCRQIAEHSEWNRRRLDAISDPQKLDGMSEEEVKKLSFWEILQMSGRAIHFERSPAWEKKNPRPPCTCGATKAWKPRDEHLETCSPGLPNMRFGPVIINWYKYLGRGTSTNVDWDEAQWREWFDSVIRAIEEWERPALERLP